MKNYVRPELEVVNLRLEERISSVGSCIMVGSCLDGAGNLIYSQQA